MKICTCHTPSHEILYRDYFLATLPESLDCHSSRLPEQDTSDFQTSGFIESIRAKVKLIRDSIDTNSGSRILWTDVDIVFAEDPLPVLNDLLVARPDVDIWFQREWLKPASDINAGFVLMRCKETVANLYEQVAALMERRPHINDQDAINYLLRNGIAVSWDYLPETFSARTHGWPPRRDFLIYHANGTVGAGGVSQKIGQFAELEKLRRFGWPYYAFVFLRMNSQKMAKQLARHYGKYVRR